MRSTRETLSGIDWLGLTSREFAAYVAERGLPAYRGRQIFHALHRRLVTSVEDIHELPQSLRLALAAELNLAPLRLVQVFDATDGTRRYLFTVRDGHAIETVWIPDGRRVTLCLSSQAGCPMMCAFCATGTLGLQRNLTAGEIVAQVLYVLREAGRRPEPAQAANVNLVLMGMGEPLLNYEQVMQALRVLADPQGLHIVPRRVTLSTVGIVPKIAALGCEPDRPRLAVSLTAPTDELRARLMPVNLTYPLEALRQVCLEFPLRAGERITFEYVLLDGVNDSEAEARALLRWLSPLRAREAAKVNLIPHNPAPGIPFRPSPPERIAQFQAVLRAKGLPTYIRRPRGRDIFAACGMLAAAGLSAS
ncbi:MAG: 23S rRNA (adenine(2503)-C(2))-methyltransferase RlmN [Chloracidobacterium sp.]|nr:23S rRNA (adenine(2503)-C(2))-methyltransferase RlmN [Chloracidobacterium sp.]MDW8217208.1 23S rRNA (adenine(2503)-C(2))-methyltransferase RlmN [Acidobacteriota bacterium]